MQTNEKITANEIRRKPTARRAAGFFMPLKRRGFEHMPIDQRRKITARAEAIGEAARKIMIATPINLDKESVQALRGLNYALCKSWSKCAEIAAEYLDLKHESNPLNKHDLSGRMAELMQWQKRLSKILEAANTSKKRKRKARKCGRIESDLLSGRTNKRRITLFISAKAIYALDLFAGEKAERIRSCGGSGKSASLSDAMRYALRRIHEELKSRANKAAYMKFAKAEEDEQTRSKAQSRPIERRSKRPRSQRKPTKADQI